MLSPDVTPRFRRADEKVQAIMCVVGVMVQQLDQMFCLLCHIWY